MRKPKKLGAPSAQTTILEDPWITKDGEVVFTSSVDGLDVVPVPDLKVALDVMKKNLAVIKPTKK